MVTSAIASVAVGLVVVTMTATPVGAGGATWKFDRPAYNPGDVATAVTAISWGHNPDLGTPEEGPYRAYVIASERLPTPGGGSYGLIPDGALPVADVEVGIGPVLEPSGILVGPNHARVRFVVPDLPHGTYDLLHCNVPCTKPLADITYGQFVIGPLPPTTTTTTPPSTSPPTTTSSIVAPSSTPTPPTTATATSPTEDGGGGEPPAALALGGATLVAATAAAAFLRHRRSSSDRQPRSDADELT